MAFFPCIYFCQASQTAFTYTYNNYQKLSVREKTDKILERSRNREYFYNLIIKLFCIVQERKMRMIVENPYSPLKHFLEYPQNFVMPPTMIDENRTLRGDYFIKPTAYWFLGCKPTYGFTEQRDKERKTIKKTRGSDASGLCSEDRSMISPDYARNFICDFILGKEQVGTQLSMFD